MPTSVDKNEVNMGFMPLAYPLLVNVDRAANNRVYINEDLSENTRKIFGAARAKLKSKLLTSAWTSNGRIHVKDNNGSFHTISSMSQLQAVARIS
jgi:hypothetical protein